MLKLLRRIKPYWKLLILVFALLLIQAVANLYLPSLNADIINNGIARGDTGYILRAGGLMLGATLILGLCAVASTYFASRVAMSYGADLRGLLFRKVQSFSKLELDQFGTPSLITRNTNDVLQVQTAVVMSLSFMVSAPIMLVGGIVMALRQDAPLSLSLAVIFPVMITLMAVIMKQAVPQFQSMQKKLDRLNLVVREKLSGIRVIRAFVKTGYEAERYDRANQDLTQTALRVNRLMAVLMPCMMLVFNFSAVVLMWFGAARIDQGAMLIGNLTAFINYVMQILFATMMAAMMFIMLPRAAASAERINQVLEAEPSITDPESPRAFGPAGRLEFVNVTFSYPGAEKPVLRNISFSAMAGEVTALIGSTGSGKSTLVNLLPRFYDVTEGCIRLDGEDIRGVTLRDLREKIALIPQKAYLFSGTVRSNLLYGKADAGDEALWRALRVAQGERFIREKPEQLDAPVAQGGLNFSGGQRQRLAIARALVKRPEVYIFDDSFSALDVKTDAALREALRAETDRSMVLIIGQRVSTIMNADRIIVLDDGGVAGIGTHSQLLETCAVYQEIVYSQLRKEEIAQ